MKIQILILFLFFTLLGSAQVTDVNQSKKVWTLEDCISYAIENNITIKDAELSSVNSAVNLKASKSSRLPNLTGSASQSLSFGNSIDPITSDFVSQQINSTNLGVNTSVTLFQGNQINNQIRQDRLLADQSLFNLEESKNNIKLSILEAYLQALYNKESIVVAENNLLASEKEVQRAKSRLDAGSIAMKDYTDAVSQSATNKYNVISAKNNYEQQILTLKQLLELGPLDTLEIEEINDNTNLVNIVPDKIEVYRQALANLPEMNSSQLNILVNEKDLDIAKGAYLPTLSLTGSLGSGYTSINYTNFVDQLNVNFNQRVGLSLSIPIFNRNQTRAQVTRAKINIDKSKLQLASTEKEIFKKIETAWQNSVSAQEQLLVAESSRNAAKESYKLAQKTYELGALSTTDLVVSQNTYTNTEQNYIQAKYLSLLYYQLLQFYQGNDIKL